MNFGLFALIISLVILHVGIGVYSWLEKRYMPLIQRITDKETLNTKLRKIAVAYDGKGIEVPQEFFQCPSVILREAKRMEIRLMIEVILVSFAGTIPSGLIYFVYG